MKNTILLMIAIAFVLVSFPVISNAGSWNGWIYQDPYPTAVNLFDVKFVTPQKGWITGKFGTMLYTEDGGENWEAQESGTEEDLMRVWFVNEKKGWTAARNGTIIHTQNGGKKWVKQYNIKALPTEIFFINEKEGWITGASPRGVVYHTTDSGKTWRKMGTGITRAISSVYFNDSQNGWILAGEDVYRTTDGGKKWEKSTLPVKMPSMGPRPLGGLPGRGSMPGTFGIAPMEEELGSEWWFGGIAFANEKQGWAAVSRWIFHTEDGGKTWTTQLDTGSMDRGLRHIAFMNTKNGCATGWSIHCTENGGKTWKERLGLGPRKDKMLGDVSLVNQSSGWVIGNNGLIMKTVDTGRSWKDVLKKNKCGSAHFFVNEKIGWSWRFGPFSFNKFCKTVDGGHSWEKQEIGIKVGSIFFIDKSTGWAVGLIEEWKDGKETNASYNRINAWAVIKHTVDGGKTWLTQHKESKDKNGFPDFVSIFFINSKTGWVVGDKGAILHTEDGGKSWQHQKTGDTKLNLYRSQFVDIKTGWVVGIHVDDRWTGTILHTDDGGKHWETQHKLKNVGLFDVYFRDKKSGWVVGKGERGAMGVLLHTEDGGKTWLERDFKSNAFYSLKFLDKDHGFISSSRGMAFITANGGKTWTKVRKPLKKHFWHVSELFENAVNDAK